MRGKWNIDISCNHLYANLFDKVPSGQPKCFVKSIAEEFVFDGMSLYVLLPSFFYFFLLYKSNVMMAKQTELN